MMLKESLVLADVRFHAPGGRNLFEHGGKWCDCCFQQQPHESRWDASEWAFIPFILDHAE